MNAELVLREQRGGVLILTFNRPDRLNAWTEQLEGHYFSLLDAAESDPTVRAVVVTGAGRGFCAGADMNELRDAQGLDPSFFTERRVPRERPLHFRKPLIAAVNGAAAGLGLVEALYCDLRFTTPTAKFTAAFSRRGLIAEYGVAWLLPRLVGVSRALDILLSSRVILGEEALTMGLVDRVVPPEDLLATAVDYAQELATQCSPEAMSVIKGQVLRAGGADFAEAVAEANHLMLRSFQTSDFAEGVASYIEARNPAFAGLGVSELERS